MLDAAYVIRWIVPGPSPTPSPTPTPTLSPQPTPECLPEGGDCDTGPCCAPFCDDHSMGYCSCQYTCQ